MIVHHLTITDHCRGPHLCHACEVLQPGLVDACRRGPVVIQEWAARERGGDISALITCCPERAIWVRPIDGRQCIG